MPRGFDALAGAVTGAEVVSVDMMTGLAYVVDDLAICAARRWLGNYREIFCRAIFLAGNLAVRQVPHGQVWRTKKDGVAHSRVLAPTFPNPSPKG